MKRFTFLKTLLVAAAVLTGNGAWADTVNGTLTHTASSFSGGAPVAYTSTVDAELEHVNNNKFGNNTWQGAAYADFAFAIPGGYTVTKAELTFTVKGESRNARNTDFMYVAAGNQLDYDALNNGDAQVNPAATTIKSISFPKGTEQTFTEDVTDALLAIIGAGQNNIIFKWTGNPGGGDVYGKGADSEKQPVLTITVVDAASTTSYTVNFLNASDRSVLKAAVVYDGQEIGKTADATEADKATFYNEDGTAKYVYASNTTTVLVADAASNSIDVLFTAYEKETYAIVAQVEGEDLTTVATGTNFLDGAETAFYSKFATKDGQWYQTAAPYRVALDAATVRVPYTRLEGVVYCSEGEDIEGAVRMEGNFQNSMSNGAAGVLADTKIATLEAGVYTITACAIGRANDRFVDFYRGPVANDDNILHVVAQNAGGVASATFVLTESTDIYGNGGYNTPSANGHACDYVYITRVASVPAEVTAAGWATLYTPYALDFSGTGLEAYTATCDGSKVTLTAVTTVPANTGVVLHGEAGTYNVPVALTSATAQGDLQGSATEATAFDAFAGNTLYVLALNADGKAQFSPVASGSIAAGKAYLKVADAAVHALNVVFGDEATGIRQVDNVQTDGIAYTLDGRRVAKPTKGLYIVNGKIVVK